MIISNLLRTTKKPHFRARILRGPLGIGICFRLTRSLFRSHWK